MTIDKTEAADGAISPENTGIMVKLLGGGGGWLSAAALPSGEGIAHNIKGWG